MIRRDVIKKVGGYAYNYPVSEDISSGWVCFIIIIYIYFVKILNKSYS